MNNYAKFFRSALTSSVWCQKPAFYWKAWSFFVISKDRDGNVFGNPVGMAHQCNITVAEFKEALDYFLSPDPDSTTPDCEGRRLIPIDGGFWVVTSEKYNEMGKLEDKRERDAQAKRTKRADAAQNGAKRRQAAQNGAERRLLDLDPDPDKD